MTIDEAIAHTREVANEQKRRNGICVQNDSECNKFSSCLKCAEEHEQLAEWLEELKTYRECNVCEYNKALDDFVRFASDMQIVEEEDGEYRPMRLEEIAEQLKAGGENEQSI